MKKRSHAVITRIYRRLYNAFGPQSWWPGDTRFEIMVGAVLTQNTNWSNVEKALANLKAAKVLDVDKLGQVPSRKLKKLIRPSGFFNVKAGRLRNYLAYLKTRYNNDISLIRRQPLQRLRDEHLAVSGIGKETADSILLYALGKPVFVVDAYTKRMLARHHIADRSADYDDVQRIFTRALPADVKIFNEYHALIVKLGKVYCKARKPLCRLCPLRSIR